jgi:hypothetical protein
MYASVRNGSVEVARLVGHHVMAVGGRVDALFIGLAAGGLALFGVSRPFLTRRRSALAKIDPSLTHENGNEPFRVRERDPLAPDRAR